MLIDLSNALGTYFHDVFVVPIAFWFFSIGGGALLLVYALYRRDPVFIAGQAFGVFIYARNLYFELRDRQRGVG
jgi:lipid-A-disaccharide synthase-like uncharacterized protein